MVDVIYNELKKSLLNGDVDWDSDTIKGALVTSDYSPNQANQDNFDDVTNEITGTGYTAGGKNLSNKTVTTNNANQGVADADDLSWSAATFTARGVVLYKDTGTPSTSKLIAYIDFGQDKEVDAGDFVVQWNASGILTLETKTDPL